MRQINIITKIEFIKIFKFIIKFYNIYNNNLAQFLNFCLDSLLIRYFFIILLVYSDSYYSISFKYFFFYYKNTLI